MFEKKVKKGKKKCDRAGIYLLHCVALIRSTSVTNQILLSEKLQVGQIERGVFLFYEAMQ